MCHGRISKVWDNSSKYEVNYKYIPKPGASTVKQYISVVKEKKVKKVIMKSTKEKDYVFYIYPNSSSSFSYIIHVVSWDPEDQPLGRLEKRQCWLSMQTMWIFEIIPSYK